MNHPQHPHQHLHLQQHHQLQQQQQQQQQQHQHHLHHHHQQQQQQQPSPALSSPSTGFFGSRASPLFSQSSEQMDPTVNADTSSALSALLNTPSSSSAAASTLKGGGAGARHDGDVDHYDNEPKAPPKQLSQAMECLSHALKIIADIRLGSDILLEAMERATELKCQQYSSSSPSPAAADSSPKQVGDFIVRTTDAMAACFEELHATGKKLEALGVLTGAQQRFEEKHPWGLQVPLICSDGAIVAYSWKRQIAGQAAASAVERTRLALKAFIEQKRHFFPRFGETSDMLAEFPAEKRAKIPSVDARASDQAKANQSSHGSLLDLLKSWKTEVPGMTISAFTRLKRKALPLDASSLEKAGILEVTFPSVFKVVISLFPSGSTTPDAVSMYSVDEMCINAHLGSTSSHAVFRRVSECAMSVLHKFVEVANPSASALNLLLHWVYTYQSLFSKPCSACKKVLALDQTFDILLPPVVRPYQQVLRLSSPWLSAKTQDLTDENIVAYHLSCTSKDQSVTNLPL